MNVYKLVWYFLICYIFPFLKKWANGKGLSGNKSCCGWWQILESRLLDCLILIPPSKFTHPTNYFVFTSIALLNFTTKSYKSNRTASSVYPFKLFGKSFRRHRSSITQAKFKSSLITQVHKFIKSKSLSIEFIESDGERVRERERESSGWTGVYWILPLFSQICMTWVSLMAMEWWGWWLCSRFC